KCAIVALGELGDPRAIEPLIPALDDKDRDRRQDAARALEQLGWQPGTDGLRARHAVARAVTQDDWDEVAGLGLAAVEPLIVAAKTWKEDAPGAVLLRVLQRSLPAVDVNALRQLAALDDVVWWTNAPGCSERVSIRFSDVRQLARQELIRR